MQIDISLWTQIHKENSSDCSYEYLGGVQSIQSVTERQRNHHSTKSTIIWYHLANSGVIVASGTKT